MPTHDDHYNFTLQTSSEMVLDSQEARHDRHKVRMREKTREKDREQERKNIATVTMVLSQVSGFAPAPIKIRLRHHIELRKSPG